MRPNRSLLLLVALALLGMMAVTTVNRPVHAQSGNLIQNPSFEAGFYTFDPDDYNWVALYPSQREDCQTTDGQYLPCNTAQTPLNWIPWWISQSEQDPDRVMPEYKPAKPPFTERIHSGNRAAQYFSFHRTHTAGLLQVVTVPANAQVRFTIFGQAWSSATDADYSDFPTAVNMRVGIDPTGGTNPYSPAIVWSGYQQPYDAYAQFAVEAQAQGDKVTVFTISSPDEPRKHNDIYWDDASLTVIGEGAPPPPAPPPGDDGGGDTGGDTGGDPAPAVAAPPVAGPSPTPNADGVIMVEVQPGDSYWSIAARHGLTIDEIYELNDADENDFIQEGDLVVVGHGDPPAADGEEAAEEVEAAAGDEAAAEAAAEAEATAVPTATLPPPTPVPTQSGGEICLKAFDDANGNGLHDAGESLKQGVAFTISSNQAVVSNYVSDGASEPYCITGLEPGNYRITRSAAAGESLTTPGEWAVSLAEGGRQSFEFGSTVDEAAAQVANTSLAGAAANSARVAAATPGEDGGAANVLVIIAVAVAVLLLVGVLVVILSARRSTV